MSRAVSTPSSGASPHPAAAGRAALACGFALGAILAAAALAPMAGITLATGHLYDNDDAMRMVQVRDFMAGQGWFDLVQHRLDPPAGLLMHWSRIVDVPLAALIWTLSLFCPPETAERLATIVWPGLLLAIFLAGLLLTARKLFAPLVVALAGALVALNPLLLFQFVPGRIDHHSLQMILCLSLAAATARAIGGSALAAALAGVASALMLAIGLETLPFVAAAAAVLGATWIWIGAPFRRPALAFGLALAAATGSLYLAFVAPARWTAATCNSLSTPWLWIFGGGGLCLAALAHLARSASRRSRAVLATLAAAALATIFAFLWPACLRGPYGAVDPVVEALWLSSVGEASPVLVLAAKDPSTFAYFVIFPLVGTLALLAASLRETSRRIVFAIFFAFAAIGFLISLAQMRGAPFSATFALFGWLWLMERALDPATPGRRSPVVRTALAIIVVLAAMPFGWSMIGETFGKSPSSDRAACDDAANLTALAAEPPGLVLAPVRLGPRILVATSHAVIAAPYHRNNRGNRVVLDAFAGSPEAARHLADETEAAYVAVCREDTDALRLAAGNPGSFIDTLLHEAPPAWLEPLVGEGPVAIWRVKR